MGHSILINTGAVKWLVMTCVDMVMSMLSIHPIAAQIGVNVTGLGELQNANLGFKITSGNSEIYS